MALIDADIRLRLLTPQEVEVSERLNNVWVDLRYRSVEALSADTEGLYDFYSHETLLYVAAIERDDSSRFTGPEPAVFFNTYGYDDYMPFVVGLAYVVATDLPGTVGIGLVLREDMRGKGFGARATCLLARWAFAELGCHRVQARVVQYQDDLSDSATRLFIGLGFSHEGIARRALFCPTPITSGPPSTPSTPSRTTSNGTNGEWRDVVTYTMLDTDWCLREPVILLEPAPGVKALWDEMFARHERESQAVAAAEERDRLRCRRRLTATSTETITHAEEAYLYHCPTPSESEYHSEAESTAERETSGEHWLSENDSDEATNSAEGSPHGGPAHLARRPNSRAIPLSLGADSHLPPHVHHTEPWASLLTAMPPHPSVSDDTSSIADSYVSADPSRYASDADLISHAESVPRSASVLSTQRSASDVWEMVEDDDAEEQGWNTR